MTEQVLNSRRDWVERALVCPVTSIVLPPTIHAGWFEHWEVGTTSAASLCGEIYEWAGLDDEIHLIKQVDAEIDCRWCQFMLTLTDHEKVGTAKVLASQTLATLAGTVETLTKQLEQARLAQTEAVWYAVQTGLGNKEIASLLGKSTTQVAALKAKGRPR